MDAHSQSRTDKSLRTPESESGVFTIFTICADVPPGQPALQGTLTGEPLEPG